MDEILFAPATELAAAIRERRVSCVEVVRAYLRRIEAVNPRINAVVQLTGDRACAEARTADAALARGDSPGLLHGVPVTIKDQFDTAGIVSTSGSTGRTTDVPSDDATAVARLRQAGAIVLGKTNVPEFCVAFETDNLVYGRSNNPYDLTRTPGGSSGGEAAIIAAGGSPLGIGTDAAGSIRWPAHCCGIAGLKPSAGLIPRTGIFPPAAGHLNSIWHTGVLARTVDDLSLALSLLAGPDGRDPSIAPVPLGDPDTVDLAGLRVAVFTDNGVIPPTPETANAVSHAATIAANAAASIEETRPDGIEEGFALTRDLFAADGGAGLGHLLQMIGTNEVSPLLGRLAAILHPDAGSVAGFGDLLVRWDIYRARMHAFLAHFDAIICPVNAHPALPHGATFDDANLPGFSYTMTFNLTGWPVVVIRAGTSPEGLPIGVQIVARPWRDDVALALARYLEQNLGPWSGPKL